jgi:hypothetical protein
MILRSVIRHVRDQNWFAVGLDFLIVVVGVFIGIQVANWNDERSERSRESGILDELAADLCTDLGEIEQTLRPTRFRFAAQATVLQRALDWQLPDMRPGLDGERPFPHPERIEIESATQALFALAAYSTFDPERAAYDGLVSSNDILLIQDKSLVDALQQHFSRVSGFNDTENNLYRGTINRLMETLERNGLGTLEAIDWPTLNDTIRSDPALQGVLKSAVYEAALQHRILVALTTETRELLKRLGRDECP